MGRPRKPGKEDWVSQGMQFRKDHIKALSVLATLEDKSLYLVVADMIADGLKRHPYGKQVAMLLAEADRPGQGETSTDATGSSGDEQP